MKNITYIFALTLLISFIACGKKQSTDNSILEGKKASLAALVQQKSDLEAQIVTLEKEILSLDPNSTSTSIKQVEVTEIQTSKFSNTIESLGKVDAESNSEVSTPMPGTVKHILVRTGQKVASGQVLATLDNEVMKRSIDQVKQQLIFAQDIYNKQKSLWDQKIGTEVQYLSAKNNVEALEKNITTLEEQSRMYAIKAPFSGTVDEIFIKQGATAAPGFTTFRIVNTKGQKLKADVAESYASKIKLGNPVSIYFPDLKKEIKGSISHVSQIVDPLNRTIKTEVSLGSGNTEIKTNMIGILRITDYVNNNAISIPLKYLLRTSEGYYVFTVKEEGGKRFAQTTPITIGMSNNGVAEVTSGLKKGDKIISKGFQLLNPGEEINF